MKDFDTPSLGRNGNEHEIRGFEEALGNVVVQWILLSRKSVEPPFRKILQNVPHAVPPHPPPPPQRQQIGLNDLRWFLYRLWFCEYFCHTNHSLCPSSPDAYKAPCVHHCRLTAVPKRSNSNKAIKWTSLFSLMLSGIGHENLSTDPHGWAESALVTLI